MKGFLCLLLLGLSVSSLKLTGPSTNAARLGSDTWVPCLFTVDNPPVDLNHLTIFWHFLDKEILSYNKTVRTNSSRYSLSTEELLTGAANLTISDIRISDGGRYKCSVIYNSERREKRLWLDVGVPPQVTITDRTVVVNEESVLRCSATGFFPIDIEVKWFRGSERLSDVIVDQPQKNPDRTYSVNSTVTITPTEEDREQNFSCRVRHFHLTDPRQVHFQLIYEDRSSAGIITACSIVVLILVIITGVLWWKLKLGRKVIGPFIVHDIVGPPKLIDGEEAVLCYTVDNAPEDLCVTWLIRRAGQEQEIQTSQMRERSEEEESLLDTSYVIKSQVVGHQYSSSLSFIPHMERHKGVTFICRGVSGHHNDEKAFHCRMIYAKPKLSKSLTRRRVRPGEIKYLLNLEKFYPQNIKIVWTCGVETTGGVVSSTESKSENPDGTYNVSSEIVIPEDQHEDPGFRVRVTWEHESMEEPESRELNIGDSGKPQMSTPIEITMAGSCNVQFSLNLQKFYPKDIKISWCREDKSDKYEISAVESIIAQDEDLTYEVTSVVWIAKYLFRDPEMKIVVEWEHEGTETSERRSLSVRDLSWRPHVGSISVPELEDGKSATLTCAISGYFPDLLSVNWFTKKDGDVTALPRTSSNSDVNYKFSNKEKRQADNTYSCEASLTFTPIISSHEGSEILCRVEHPSAERPVERSTAPLHIGERIYG
ncbi:uncharacterized protein LOC143785348 [Ranitomeya variabilis]|uniref:uncharacterized protein LOC143785348 n=1 Tax=Ranitomeya variabilis TaxID=490064 RepID=UPI004055E8FE